MINIQKTESDIITLSIENKDGDVNVINEKFLTHFETLVEEITRDDSTKGLIFTSAKKDFLVGADLDFFISAENPLDIYKLSRRLQKNLRSLEKWGKPVVAAINGSALGGGFELALACHYRVVINHHSIKLGLPEVTLGLMPGGGGTQRLPRLIGIEKSLPYLLKGKSVSPQKAREQGLVHALAENQSELIEKAKAFIEQFNSSEIDHEKKATADPHSPRGKAGQNLFAAMTASLSYPGATKAPLKILSSVYEGMLVPLERGCEIEARYFAELAHSPQSNNMIRTLFYGVNNCKKQFSSFTESAAPFKKVGIIGGGIMGSGIAGACVSEGIEVVIKDLDLTGAEFSKNNVSQKFNKLIKRGVLTEEQKERALGLVSTTDSFEDFSTCDLIIEATYEDSELKKSIFKELAPFCREDVVVASNTSSLPIINLMSEDYKPENFLGIHFFSPVEQMPLVEVIKTSKSDRDTLFRVLKFVKDLSKVPIIVNDSFGFFTTRVFTRYIVEAVHALYQGHCATIIENAGRDLGFPLGPLEIADEVSLNLIRSILGEKAKINGVDGLTDISEKNTYIVANSLISKHSRLGKKSKKGFYDYPAKESKLLSEETKRYRNSEVQIGLEQMKERLLFIQIKEALSCLEEGILSSATEGDVASLLGWGFPPELGGVFTYCNEIGLQETLDKLLELEKDYGPRFSPPKVLKSLLNKNYEIIHDADEFFKPIATIEES